MKSKLIILSLLFCMSCNKKVVVEKPKRWLEDIHFDVKSDKENFLICNGEQNIYQYFNIGNNIEIEGDKPYILRHFKNGYNQEAMPKESGLIRIRFIVNCIGEADRYRVIESDLDYRPKKMNKKIIKNLLDLTKSLKGWKHKMKDGSPVDYYQYLIFRIDRGRIAKILP